MVDPPIPVYIDYNGTLSCTRCFRRVTGEMCIKCNTIGYCFDAPFKKNEVTR